MLSIQTIRMPRKLGLSHRIEVELHEDMVLEQWIIPKGTNVTTFQTQNFGWVVLPEHCQDKRGFTVPRRIFKY